MDTVVREGLLQEVTIELDLEGLVSWRYGVFHSPPRGVEGAACTKTLRSHSGI